MPGSGTKWLLDRPLWLSSPKLNEQIQHLIDRRGKGLIGLLQTGADGRGYGMRVRDSDWLVDIFSPPETLETTSQVACCVVAATDAGDKGYWSCSSHLFCGVRRCA